MGDLLAKRNIGGKKKHSGYMMSMPRNKCECMGLNPVTLGISGGLLWGLGLSLMTLMNIMTGYGTFFIALVESVYPGYSATVGGVLIALIYGFIDAFVGMYLLAWLYNKMGGDRSC
jgi:hypothetical protein